MKKTLTILAVLATLTVVIVVGGYWTATRPAFIRAQIIPRLSKRTGTEIAVNSIALSPFSKIELGGLRLGPVDNPLLTGKTIRCRYSLFSLLGGTLKVNELLVDDLDIRLVAAAPENPTTDTAKQGDSGTSTRPSLSSPVKMDLNNILLKNINIGYEQKDAAGRLLYRLEINNLNAAVPALIAGRDITCQVDASFAMQRPDRVDIRQGRLSGTLRTDLNADLLPNSLNVDFRVDALQGSVGGIDLARRSLSLTGAAVRKGPRLQLENLRFQETFGETPEAIVSLNGYIQESPRAAELVLNADPLTPTLFNLMGQSLGDYHLGQTSGRYQARLTMPDETQIRIEGTAELNSASFASDKLGIQTQRPVAMSLSHQASIVLNPKAKPAAAEGKARIAVRLANGGELANLDAAGTATLLPPKARQAQLSLTSTRLDLTTLKELVLVKPETSLAKAPPTTTPTAPQSPVATSEPKAIQLGDMPATIRLNLQNVTYGQLQLSSATGTIQVKNNIVTLDPTELVLNQATIRLKGRLNLGVPGYQYQLETNLADLSVSPLVQTFLPDLKGSIEAKVLALNAELNGTGTTLPNLEKHLKAKMSAKLGPMQLMNVPILDKLALAFGIEELRNPRFDHGSLELSAANGLVSIAECSLADPQRKLHLSGTVSFAQLLNLQTRLRVAGKLEEKLAARGLGHLLTRQQDGFAELPLAIPVRGTISQPVVDFNPARLVRDAAVQTGRSLLESAIDSAIEGRKLDKNLLKDVLKTAPPLDKTPNGHETTAPETPDQEPDQKSPSREELRKARQEEAKSLLLERLFGK